MVRLWDKILIWLRLKKPRPIYNISIIDLDKMFKTVYTPERIERMVYSDHPLLKLLLKDEEQEKN